MSRPYCYRCQTEVVLDSDGQSCPNCGAVLMVPASEQSGKPAAKRRAKAPARSAA